MDAETRDVEAKTEILRMPRQLIATFSPTSIHYYVLTESENGKTIIRKGQLIWERPRLFTPIYLLNLLEIRKRESQDHGVLEAMVREKPDAALISYRREENKLQETKVTLESVHEVSQKLIEILDEGGDISTGIIKGVEESWEISLSVFTDEVKRKSTHSVQFPELRRMELVETAKEGYPAVVKDSTGFPVSARIEIENLFRQVQVGESKLTQLAEELRSWDVFEEYQDRFFGLVAENE